VSNVEGLDSLYKRLHAIGDTQAMLKHLQASTEAEAKARVPRRSGHLFHSIMRGRLTNTTAEVVARTPYAAAQEFGARPHVIKPKNASVLAFPATAGGRTLAGLPTVGARRNSPGLGRSTRRPAGGIKLVGLGQASGTMRFYRSVHHPGNKPHPYMIPGAKAAIAKSGEIITIAWNGAA
jgi:hypothetical protein